MKIETMWQIILLFISIFTRMIQNIQTHITCKMSFVKDHFQPSSEQVLKLVHFLKTCSMAEWIVHHQTNNRIDLSSRLNKCTQSHLPVFNPWFLWHARQRSTPAKFINIYHGIICGTQRQSTHCFSSSLSLIVTTHRRPFSDLFIYFLI